VVIFGGEHPDVPLEESAGETIAKVIVEKRFPAILDVSLMRKGARIRFMQDFCETLYHHNRQALHFFVDEAHTIAPQKVFPEKVTACTRRDGGHRFAGPAARAGPDGDLAASGAGEHEHADAMLNVHRHAHRRSARPKAIEEWTEAHGTPERAAEMMASLATLKKGEAWVWSVWLDLFKRLRFRQRETFDSSATPEVGKSAVGPKIVAEIDLNALGEQIKSTVERAKENDPRALKAKLAELQRQLATRPERASRKGGGENRRTPGYRREVAQEHGEHRRTPGARGHEAHRGGQPAGGSSEAHGGGAEGDGACLRREQFRS
jgi:hypothetical protein